MKIHSNHEGVSIVILEKSIELHILLRNYSYMYLIKLILMNFIVIMDRIHGEIYPDGILKLLYLYLGNR